MDTEAKAIPTVTIDTLLNRYPVVLLDAYGVLVTLDGPLPGARELIETLNRRGQCYYLVTNTAARTPAHAAARYRRFGLPIPPHRIITAGSLLARYFAANQLVGKRCRLLGPPDSATYVDWAGGTVVAAGEDFDVLVLADQAGFPLLETLDEVLSRLTAKWDAGDVVPLILPNPDLIYPMHGGFGITSGSLAVMFEAVLRLRYPDRPDLGFVRLGKPEPAIFEEALRRAGSQDAIMIGDQLETDIRGANACGIDSAWVASGVARREAPLTDPALRPTYRLEHITPGGNHGPD